MIQLLTLENVVLFTGNLFARSIHLILSVIKVALEPSDVGNFGTFVKIQDIFLGFHSGGSCCLVDSAVTLVHIVLGVLFEPRFEYL